MLKAAYVVIIQIESSLPGVVIRLDILAYICPSLK
jgi:hypothetical protein